MPAGGGDRQGAFGGILPPHVGKIDVVSGQLHKLVFPQMRDRFHFEFARKVTDRLGQMGIRHDLDPFDHRRLAGVHRRHQKSAQTLFGGGHRHRQHPFAPANRPVERQLADDRDPVEKIGLELPSGGDHSQRDRHVERRGLFRHVGGRQVHQNAVRRNRIAGIFNRARNAVRTLLDDRFGESDDRHAVFPAARNVDLDLDRNGLDSAERIRFEFYEHQYTSQAVRSSNVCRFRIRRGSPFSISTSAASGLEL